MADSSGRVQFLMAISNKTECLGVVKGIHQHESSILSHLLGITASFSAAMTNIFPFTLHPFRDTQLQEFENNKNQTRIHLHSVYSNIHNSWLVK